MLFQVQHERYGMDGKTLNQPPSTLICMAEDSCWEARTMMNR